MRIGIISGYFNPIHTGHLDYIEGAKQKCDLLYVIVNNDHQVNIKGSKQFMDEDSRLRIVRYTAYRRLWFPLTKTQLWLNLLQRYIKSTTIIHS